MIIFAICTHALLLHLATKLGPRDTMGSFADDIAIVLENILTSGPSIVALFKEMELVSGLSLNLLKCIGVPLSANYSMQAAKTRP